MSSKGSKTSTATKKETVAENVVVLEKKNVKKELVQTGADIAAPVVATASVAKEEVKAQKGGKKVAVVETTAATPTPVQVVAAKEETKAQKGGKKVAVVEAAPVVTPAKEEVKAQKGGKKVAVAVVEAAPAVPVVPVVAKEETKAQKGGKKAAKVEVAPVVQAAGVAGVVEAKAPKEKKVKAEKGEAAAPVVQAAGAGGAGGDDVEAEEEVLGSKLRYFKLLYNDNIQGRYSGKKPKQAANKAFSSIIKTLKEGNQQDGGVNLDINFTIKECTRNSKHKDYKYIGKRQALDNPVKVEIANADGTVKQIEYKFFNKLQKAPKV
jgi:hypothetical protein